MKHIASLLAAALSAAAAASPDAFDALLQQVKAAAGGAGAGDLDALLGRIGAEHRGAVEQLEAAQAELKTARFLLGEDHAPGVASAEAVAALAAPADAGASPEVGVVSPESAGVSSEALPAEPRAAEFLAPANTPTSSPARALGGYVASPPMLPWAGYTPPAAAPLAVFPGQTPGMSPLGGGWPHTWTKTTTQGLERNNFVDQPPRESSRFGYNICRNVEQADGGCCQQIVGHCCLAHARDDPTIKWRMCFCEKSQILKVQLDDGTCYEILANKLTDDEPGAWHAFFNGPEECFGRNNYVIYEFGTG